ncbi:hypothetical protein ALC60_10617 [Trachymyrmex zeteki]|uniref:Uncharacterized protein n=1 Tax=Mycetomoellerius zeteki TaxID=64791 RepID=A0A151WR65_9HYME|nr:hypothetical protein ALC60_10617 [Trachymyrmex zeteki]
MPAPTSAAGAAEGGPPRTELQELQLKAGQTTDERVRRFRFAQDSRRRDNLLRDLQVAGGGEESFEGAKNVRCFRSSILSSSGVTYAIYIDSTPRRIRRRAATSFVIEKKQGTKKNSEKRPLKKKTKKNERGPEILLTLSHSLRVPPPQHVRPQCPSLILLAQYPSPTCPLHISLSIYIYKYIYIPNYYTNILLILLYTINLLKGKM